MYIRENNARTSEEKLREYSISDKYDIDISNEMRSELYQPMVQQNKKIIQISDETRLHRESRVDEDNILAPSSQQQQQEIYREESGVMLGEANFSMLTEEIVRLPTDHMNVSND